MRAAIRSAPPFHCRDKLNPLTSLTVRPQRVLDDAIVKNVVLLGMHSPHSLVPDAVTTEQNLKTPPILS